MMNDFKRIIIGSIIRRAKDLTDEEVLSLYHEIKDKLSAKDDGESQVLDGESHGEEPNQETTSEKEPISDQEIDELLQSLGLAGEQTSSKDADDSIDPAVETGEDVQEETEGKEDGNDAKDQADESPTETDTKENDGKEAGIEEGINEHPDNEADNAEWDEVQSMIEKVSDEITKEDDFSPRAFKTARRGMQVKRKDKDLMADGVEPRKYTDPSFRPPRTDERNPYGERYKKNNKNRDEDVDNDPDLKS